MHKWKKATKANLKAATYGDLWRVSIGMTCQACDRMVLVSGEDGIKDSKQAWDLLLYQAGKADRDIPCSVEGV